jgi:hypothetical protein
MSNSINGIKYMTYKPDIAGANPYYIALVNGKLFYTNYISKNTLKKDFNRPVKYDRSSKRILLGPFNFDPKDTQYSSELRKIEKLLDVNEYVDEYLASQTEPANSGPVSIGAEPEKPEGEKPKGEKQKQEDPKGETLKSQDFKNENILFLQKPTGSGRYTIREEEPFVVIQRSHGLYMRRLKKDFKNFKGDDRFYKYPDNKDREYLIKNSGQFKNGRQMFQVDKEVVDGKESFDLYRDKDIGGQGGDMNKNISDKENDEANKFHFGSTQDYSSFFGLKNFQSKSDILKPIGVNNENLKPKYTSDRKLKTKTYPTFAGGMTDEEIEAYTKDTDSFPKRDNNGAITVFPKSRSYDYVYLGDDKGLYKYVVRIKDKLYLTSGIPRVESQVQTFRPLNYDEKTKTFSNGDFKITSSQLSMASGISQKLGKNNDRNSINTNPENLFKTPEPAKPAEPPQEPVTPPAGEEPERMDRQLKKNDVPNENLEEIPPESKGDAVGAVKDAGGVNQITQQDEGVQLISEDEVNLNVVNEKDINPYKIEKKEDVPSGITKPDGTPLTNELLEKMKSSYNIDRYDAENQSKSFIEYYNQIKSEHPRKLEYYLDESDILGSSFNTFLSNLEDTMEVGEEDLYQFYGNDMYKGAARSVPLILNPNLVEQPDADYVIEDRYTENSFGAIVLAGLMFRALKKEKIVLKNADGDGVIETTFLDHTDNALKSRLGKNFYTASKMDLTQLRFYVCISLAAIFSARQRTMPRHRLNNTIVRIINSIPYVGFNLNKKDVEDMVKDFRQLYIEHPVPFKFGPLSEFYEKVTKYVFELNPNFNFEYLFNHISTDLQKLVPAIEKAFRTRQDFKEFLIRLYENHSILKQSFNDFNEFIKGNRRLTAEDFSNKFTNGEDIFGNVDADGEEYQLFDAGSGELIERVFIPFDETQKAVTLFINEEGRYYESREEERTDFVVQGQAPDLKEGQEQFKTSILKEAELPNNFLDSMKGMGTPFLKAIMTGAVGQSIGKLFKDASRDELLEAVLARSNMVSALIKLDLLGYDPDKTISQEQVDKLQYNHNLLEEGFNPEIFGQFGDQGLFPTPDLDKALLSKKIRDIAFPDNFLGKFSRFIPSFDEIVS